MSLEQGSALIVEDLDVTMQVITFTEPRIETRAYLNRLLKNLKDRNIEYEMVEKLRKSPWGNWYNVQSYLKVGNREVVFEVRDVSNQKRPKKETTLLDLAKHFGVKLYETIL